MKKHTLHAEFTISFQNYTNIKTSRKVINAVNAYDVSKSLLTAKNVSKTAWAMINN